MSTNRTTRVSAARARAARADRRGLAVVFAPAVLALLLARPDVSTCGAPPSSSSGRAAAGAPAGVQLPNPEFRLGTDTPTGWSLVGQGRWVDRDQLEVTGNGNDSSYWKCDTEFEPGRLYSFRVRARRLRGSGLAITGPTFANHDHRSVKSEWQWLEHVFRVPDQVRRSAVRLGQWHATGAIQFDAVEVRPVVAVHRRFDELVLGSGEWISGLEYTFASSFGDQGGNYHRTLARATAGFNTNRWVFSPGSEVVYRFELPGRRFESATVDVNVSYHARGRCVVEVSRDGRRWLKVAELTKVQTVTASVPQSLFPASRLLLRLRPADGPASFQVNRLELRGRLSGQPMDAVGQTLFAELERTGRLVTLDGLFLRHDPQSGRDELVVTLSSAASRREWVTVELADPARPEPLVQEVVCPAGGQAAVSFPVWKGPVGERSLVLRLRTSDGEPTVAKLTVRVPDFYRTDYGERLLDVPGAASVWWCDATRKVPRQRALPERRGQAARMEAAKNDWEAVQVVVRPHRRLVGLTATVTDLTGPNGAVIPARNVRVLRVYYHFVRHPTDYTGVRDWWPDALPPLDEPLSLPADSNQPLWVLVYVPPKAVAGDYEGVLQLRAEQFQADVPLRLHVWDFALPERNHLETAYGLSFSDVFRYHGAKTEEQKRRLVDLYFQSFAEHRISPYNPTPLDPIRVQFLPDAHPPRAEVDFSDFDRAMERAVKRYHFTNFRLKVEGMGGGTFHKRYPPKIGKFTAGTPQYEAMFSSYVRQLEEHLRQKGWLEMAYVYWFDEPSPKDYEFVAAGMRRLKKYAAGLRRMLTEEPGDNVLAGLVDIWCPVTPNYDHQMAEKRRAFGERFWWYVCTGPKAPYCTLFIDHPATELRVWHWQTWQRNIVGTLVWRANYWTSRAAYPDQPQNPYEDPMSYVSGYSTPRGVRRFWGNGDGRFLYPPLAAAVPGKSPHPVLEPPVSSIRWEMIREGVEDYEMLYLLRDLLKKKRNQLDDRKFKQFKALLQVPAEITSDMTTFTTDPAPIYARRREVAQAIEQLTQLGNGP